jgi:hypothetical protein
VEQGTTGVVDDDGTIESDSVLVVVGKGALEDEQIAISTEKISTRQAIQASSVGFPSSTPCSCTGPSSSCGATS